MTPERATGRRSTRDAPRVAAAAALVGAATFLCFLPSLRNGLLAWDDAGYITNNPNIRTLSIDTVLWAFGEFYCNDWAPLTWLSLAADHALWGLDPKGYHLTNAVLHALNAALFLLLARRLLEWPRVPAWAERCASPNVAGARSLGTAALAALFFSVHPLRVESVAWAVERKDVLSVLFGLCAVLAYLHHATPGADGPEGAGAPRGRAAAYLLSLTLYSLSLMSKAGLVTLPAVLLVLDWFPLGRFRTAGWRRVLTEKVPYLIVAAPVALLTVSAHAPQTKTLAEVDLTTRVLLAFRAIVEYLRLTVLPLDVSPVYLHPGNIGRVTAGQVLPAVLTLAITAWVLAVARRRPALAAVWIIYLVTLAPVVGLLQNGPQWMAARFTYVPAMGLSVLAALGVEAAHRRVGSSRPWRSIVAGSAAAILLGYAALTVRDISWWNDDVTLWTRSIELNPRVSGKQYFLRALAHRGRGEFQLALADLDVAHAIAAAKGYGAAHEIVAARARVFRDMGDYDRAVAEFDRAISSATLVEARMYLAERAALQR